VASVGNREPQEAAPLGNGAGVGDENERDDQWAVSVKRDPISLQKRPTNTLPTQGWNGADSAAARDSSFANPQPSAQSAPPPPAVIVKRDIISLQKRPTNTLQTQVGMAGAGPLSAQAPALASATLGGDNPGEAGAAQGIYMI
jgi:hypothetical protein